MRNLSTAVSMKALVAVFTLTIHVETVVLMSKK